MKIAVVSPGILPVPAVEGGAVEELTTKILSGMDSDSNIIYDLYTIPSSNYSNVTNQGRKVYFINPNFFDIFISKIYNFLNKVMNKKNRLKPDAICVARKIRNVKYDYILIENNMDYFISIFLFTLNKNNLLFHLHNDLDDYSKSRNKSDFILKKCYRYIVVSKFLKDRILEKNKKYEAKVSILWNAINPEKYFFSNVYKNNIRKRYNILDTDIVLLYIGRIFPDKGVLELCKAYKIVREKYSNVKLVIVGDTTFGTEEEKKYFNKIKENLIAGVYLVGRVATTECTYYYSASDIVIIPTLCEEAFGLVALESMCASKMIIATKSGGMANILDESYSIMLDKNVKRRSFIENLANAIIKCIEDPVKREYMRKLAKKEAISNKNYNEKYYYNNFLEILGVNDD